MSVPWENQARLWHALLFPSQLQTTRQSDELDLGVSELTNAMAHAMAVLHWHTRIDGNDIEFVLGSSPMEDQKVRGRMNMDTLKSYATPTSTYEKTTHSRADFNKRLTSLWMIDFDDCGDITMDESGVDKAVKAFLETNHYCPRPNTPHEFITEAWNEFGRAYLQWSARVLDRTASPHLKHLPHMFLVKVQQQTQRRERETGAGQGGKGKRC